MNKFCAASCFGLATMLIAMTLFYTTSGINLHIFNWDFFISAIMAGILVFFGVLFS